MDFNGNLVDLMEICWILLEVCWIWAPGGGGERARWPRGGLGEASRRPQGGKGARAGAPYEVLRTTKRSSEDLTRRWARGPANFIPLLHPAFVYKLSSAGC